MYFIHNKMDFYYSHHGGEEKRFADLKLTICKFEYVYEKQFTYTIKYYSCVL